MPRCEYFGLLAGERFTLSGLGAIGYLMRNSATVGGALRALLLHRYRYGRIAVPALLGLEPSFAFSHARRRVGVRRQFGQCVSRTDGRRGNALRILPFLELHPAPLEHPAALAHGHARPRRSG